MTTVPGIGRSYVELEIGTGTWMVLKNEVLGNIRLLLRHRLAIRVVRGVTLDPSWSINWLAFPGGGLVLIETGSESLPVYHLRVKDVATTKELAEQLEANRIGQAL